MAVFHFFKIVQMVPNHAKHQLCMHNSLSQGVKKFESYVQTVTINQSCDIHM